MARKDDLLGVSAAETVIGSGVRVKGTLVGEGDMTIDGLISGDVKTAGNLVVGVNAIIKGNVRARSTRIGGQVDGDIVASSETAITETGRVRGNITTASLAIAAGAIFVGSSHMTQTEAQEIPSEKT